MTSFFERPLIGFLATALFALLALGLRRSDHLKGFTFTFWVFAAVSFALFFPDHVREIRGFQTTALIIPLIQLNMFGMGTVLSVGDLTAVIRQPKGVLVGVLCQFLLMPLLGIAIALLFGFPPEVAAGLVLVGAAPGGIASNVMTFIARGNLALSIALTAVATLLAPVMTPLLMKALAGQFVSISFRSLLLSMISMIVLPIAAALLFRWSIRGRARWFFAAMPALAMAAIVIIIALITAAGRDNLLSMGLLLILAVVMHNSGGLVLGYCGARLAGLDERSSRTVAFEVGMQNSGLAAGIAADMGRAATMGLAPAVFSAWHNLSGSVLANWWRSRPASDEGRITA